MYEGGLSLQAVAKSLYRQLRRALSQWPERRALTPIVRLWCAYMAPWWPPYDTSADTRHPFLAASSSGAQQQHQQAQVLEAISKLCREIDGLVNGTLMLPGF